MTRYIIEPPMDVYADAIEGVKPDPWSHVRDYEQTADDPLSRLDHMDMDRIVTESSWAPEVGRHVLENAIDDAGLTRAAADKQAADAVYVESHRLREVVCTLACIALIGGLAWGLIMLAGWPK